MTEAWCIKEWIKSDQIENRNLRLFFYDHPVWGDDTAKTLTRSLNINSDLLIEEQNSYIFGHSTKPGFKGHLQASLQLGG